VSRWQQSVDFPTLKIEKIPSSETSVHTKYTRRHIPEDDVLHVTLCLRSTHKYICLQDTEINIPYSLKISVCSTTLKFTYLFIIRISQLKKVSEMLSQQVCHCFYERLENYFRTNLFHFCCAV
jgi:hypothetical protein